jgi:hypothetical protein
MEPTPLSRRGPGPWLPWALTAGAWLVAAAAGALAPKEAPAAIETPPPARSVLDGLLTTHGAAALVEKPGGAAAPADANSEARDAAPPTKDPPQPSSPPEENPEGVNATPPVPADRPEPVAATAGTPAPTQARPTVEATRTAHPAERPPAPRDPAPARAATTQPAPAAPAAPAPAPAEPPPPEPAPAKAPSLSEALAVANTHLNASRWTEAETAFSAALTLPGGRSAAVLFGRARARDGLGRTSDALSDLEAALALDPRHPYALLLAGDIARLTRDTATAAARYRAYLEAWPKGRRAAEIERWLSANGG